MALRSSGDIQKGKSISPFYIISGNMFYAALNRLSPSMDSSEIRSKGLPLRKKPSFSTAFKASQKLRRSFGKAGGIGTCVLAVEKLAFPQSCRKASFNAALSKPAEKPALPQL